MDLQERTKQFALCLIWIYPALLKDTETQVINRQALCAGTSVGAYSRQGRYNHAGEHCGARHPG